MTTHRTGDERTAMEYQLEAQRSDLAMLLDDLTEEEARARLVPSLTTPLGLVKHATFVEQVWFHHRVAGMSLEQVGLPETVDESFDWRGTPVTLRYLYAHLLTELGRHAGHGEILVEQLRAIRDRIDRGQDPGRAARTRHHQLHPKPVPSAPRRAWRAG